MLRANARVLLIGLLSGPCLSFGQSASSKLADIHAHLQKGQAALQTNDPATAATEFRYVLKQDPKNVEAHVNLGVLEMFQGDCRAASQDFRQALTAQPSLIKAKALLGICGRRLGDSGAQDLLETSFAKLADPKLRTQVGMELVGLHYERGDPERAVSVVQKLIDLNPEDANILYMAQRLYGELADDTLNKLAVVAPDSARMQQVIAERLINGGDVEGAIVHYRKALEIQPRLPGVHFELAEALLESAHDDAAKKAEAQKELKIAVEVEGDTAKTECEFGSIALSDAQIDQALAHYQRAYQLDPNEVQAQMGLAKVLMMQEKPQEAVKYLRLAVQSDPLNGSAHYQLGRAYKRLQMTDAAQKEMRLYQEIRKTKDQVQSLYHQMNRRTQPEADEVPDSAAEPH